MTTKKSKSPKASKKAPATKQAAAPVIEETAVLEASEVDSDADEFESAGGSSRSSGGMDAGLTAAMAAGAASSSLKNFRHHPDMENFYRFIFENDLRYEALTIVDAIIKEKLETRAKTKAKH